MRKFVIKHVLSLLVGVMTFLASLASEALPPSVARNPRVEATVATERVAPRTTDQNIDVAVPIDSKLESEPVDPSFSCDPDLKACVEQLHFVVEDNGVLAAIGERPRKSLIRELLKMRDEASKSDGIRVKIAYLFCRLGYRYEQNRAVIISAMGPKEEFTDCYADDAADGLGILIGLGDDDLISTIIDATTWSDGGLAEEISDILANEALSKPRELLIHLRNKANKTRRAVYDHINFGILDANRKLVILHLAPIPKNSVDRRIANEMIGALSRDSQD